MSDLDSIDFGTIINQNNRLIKINKELSKNLITSNQQITILNRLLVILTFVLVAIGVLQVILYLQK